MHLMRSTAHSTLSQNLRVESALWSLMLAEHTHAQTHTHALVYTRRALPLPLLHCFDVKTLTHTQTHTHALPPPPPHTHTHAHSHVHTHLHTRTLPHANTDTHTPCPDAAPPPLLWRQTETKAAGPAWTARGRVCPLNFPAGSDAHCQVAWADPTPTCTIEKLSCMQRPTNLRLQLLLPP